MRITFALAVLFIYHILICIFMSSRNIAVQKAVYDLLLREKRGGESFTSLFRRLLDQRGGLEEMAGSWGRASTRRDRTALRAASIGGPPSVRALDTSVLLALLEGDPSLRQSLRHWRERGGRHDRSEPPASSPSSPRTGHRRRDLTGWPPSDAFAGASPCSRSIRERSRRPSAGSMRGAAYRSPSRSRCWRPSRRAAARSF